MSGGEGVAATDACEMKGLVLAPPSDKTHRTLRRIFPPWEITLNPFDTGACMEFHMDDPIGFFGTLAAIPEDENVDCVIMQMPPDIYDFLLSNPIISMEVADSIIREFIQGFANMKKAGKPLAMWLSTMDVAEQELVEIMESQGLPVFRSAERAIRSLAAMARYRARAS